MTSLGFTCRRRDAYRHFRTRATVFCVLPLVVACGSSDKGADGAAPAATPDSAAATPAASITFSAAQVLHGGVQWTSVAGTDAATSIELPGQLMPDADRSSQIGAPAPGRVITVHVRPGDRVAAGQALVTLQSADASAARADYEKAVAQVASARAASAFARLERERAQRLLAIKAASRGEVDRAEAEDDIARGALQQAEAELSRARAARDQMGATSASGAMVIRAPMRGVVLTRDAIPGSVIDAGATLVTITDPGTLWLDISASDRDAGSVRRGAHVRFTVPAYPADTFGATVQSVGAGLDTASRTVPVRAVVRNTDGRLRPAMFATTWIDDGVRRAVMMLPTDAIQQLGNRTVVFIAKADTKGGATFERREVRLGSVVGSRTQVLSGVTAGEQVVTAGAFAIKSEFARPQMAKE